MRDPDDTETISCGSTIHFPPAHCSRPAGHRGEHSTAEIPQPLAAAAARMVTESDRLERQADDAAAEIARHIRRLRFLVAVCVGVIVVFCVVVAVLVNAAYFVVPPR